MRLSAVERKLFLDSNAEIRIILTFLVWEELVIEETTFILTQTMNLIFLPCVFDASPFLNHLSYKFDHLLI